MGEQAVVTLKQAEWRGVSPDDGRQRPGSAPATSSSWATPLGGEGVQQLEESKKSLMVGGGQMEAGWWITCDPVGKPGRGVCSPQDHCPPWHGDSYTGMGRETQELKTGKIL